MPSQPARPATGDIGSSIEAVPLPPEAFDGYTGVVTLAHGTHSTVYRATESATGRPVALKVLDVSGVTPRELEAFAREIAVLATLSTHPHIVTMYRSFHTSDGRPVLALEPCRGSLAERLRGGPPMASRDAVGIAIKLAGALETAHRGGVLHRDVRPANVLVTEYGEPALADFGVALLRSTRPAAAELFDFPGEHVAPELLLGLPATEASDVYGLASTLYEVLAGGPPLAAYADERPAATILRILRDPARPVVREDMPVGLNDLVLWALAKEPEQRPPSLAWFAEELTRIEAQGNWAHTGGLIREPGAPVFEPAPARLLRPTRARPRLRVRARPRAGDRYPLGRLSVPPGPLPPSTEAVVRAPWRSVFPGTAAATAPLWVAALVGLPLAAPVWWLWLIVLVALLGATAAVTALTRPTLVASAGGLRHRWLLRRDALSWPRITGLQAVYEPARRPGGPHGLLVACCTDGDSVPLLATRRPAGELGPLAEQLERYRPLQPTV